MSKWGRKRRKPPAGYDYVEPILDALEGEMRDAVNAPHEGKRKVESTWTVHQITWQRSRYIYDMYYKYKKISRPLYDYLLREKLADAALIAKWKKAGFERLCSVHVINTKNTKFGTTSICRVPRHHLAEGTIVQAQLTGCRGCCSGPGGHSNIFGNKYGQYLAALQIAREEAAEREGSVYVPSKATAYGTDQEELSTMGKDIAKRKKKEALAAESWLGGGGQAGDDGGRDATKKRKDGEEGDGHGEDDTGRAAKRQRRSSDDGAEADDGGAEADDED